MNNGMLTIEQIIGMNFPKYTTLNEANKIFSGSTANNINIYIDGYQVIHTVLSAPNIAMTPVTGIVSSIVNLCAHLRSYYRTVFSVESKIFIVFADGWFPYNSDMYLYYNHSFKNKYINNQKFTKLIEDNVILLEELCKYLPDIYFIKRTVEPAVVIYDLINFEAANGNVNPNVVLSKDNYMLLLPATMQNNNTVVFKLCKPIVQNQNNQEYIATVNCNNAVDTYFTFDRKNINMATKEEIKKFNPSKFSLLLTLTNVSSRNIKSLKHLNVAIAIVKELIESNKLSNFGFYDISKVYDMMPDNVTSLISKNAFINRWKAIDIPFQHMVYKSFPASCDVSWNVNLSDANAVKAINNRYFVENPIDLNRL